MEAPGIYVQIAFQECGDSAAKGVEATSALPECPSANCVFRHIPSSPGGREGKREREMRDAASSWGACALKDDANLEDSGKSRKHKDSVLESISTSTAGEDSWQQQQREEIAIPADFPHFRRRRPRDFDFAEGTNRFSKSKKLMKIKCDGCPATLKWKDRVCPIEGMFVHYEMIRRYTGLQVIGFDLDCFNQG